MPSYAGGYRLNGSIMWDLCFQLSLIIDSVVDFVSVNNVLFSTTTALLAIRGST
ncbi:hypothetical protein HETIRDRAFT_314965 [Heterobasidion irregulare TC 32-1]|uniref:Uncharacterized protein n=1 Tax=Heterobasidion irregulare (strain TC 32-1) TaxID=747525 RepID=W4KB31_HETIT|nr:uncharacterized protein HETIRDRAFT_314965 [Heterobasidion irregulare TC 32-1]ETW82575.1 hypothetical protein HETIRDRAFT_314965 [Heterobasidion irregulare TC 32-1]